MRYVIRCAVAGMAVVVAGACSDDGSATGPSGSSVDGVRYSAQVEESIARNGRKLFMVSVTLTNTSTRTVSRRYPTGCAVQVRLYNPLNNGLVYDESTRECSPTDSLTVSIEPGASVKLSSGLRYPTTITATVPAIEYDVRAVARTERPTPVEVGAGRYTIPFYNDG